LYTLSMMAMYSLNRGLKRDTLLVLLPNASLQLLPEAGAGGSQLQGVVRLRMAAGLRTAFLYPYGSARFQPPEKLTATSTRVPER
jgi:hypothetical protein